MYAMGRRVAAREDLNTLDRKFEKSEDDLKAIQNVGQIIGEVLKQLDEDRCAFSHLVVGNGHSVLVRGRVSCSVHCLHV